MEWVSDKAKNRQWGCDRGWCELEWHFVSGRKSDPTGESRWEMTMLVAIYSTLWRSSNNSPGFILDGHFINLCELMKRSRLHSQEIIAISGNDWTCTCTRPPTNIFWQYHLQQPHGSRLKVTKTRHTVSQGCKLSLKLGYQLTPKWLIMFRLQINGLLTVYNFITHKHE